MTITCANVTNNPVAVVAVGNLTISSNIPTGATIYIRNSTTDPAALSYGVANTTPRTITGIEIGTSIPIKLTYAGYQDYTTTVNISSGETTTLSANMTLLTGSVSFISTPSGAEIYINNDLQDFETTPSAPITGLTPGTNNYTYKLTKTDYTDITGTFSVAAGENTPVSATFSGSATITSTPSGAEIFLAAYPDTPTDQGFATLKTFGSMTDVSPGATKTWNYKLTKSLYEEKTGSFLATAGQIIEVPITMFTVSDIRAQSMTVTPTDPCIQGSCSVLVSITWVNNGETIGNFVPNISIDSGNVAFTTPYGSQSIAANGGTLTKTFTITGLTAAGSPHSICPVPN